MYPVIGGTIAPPTMAMHMIPDPSAARLSSPSDASEKMVGNMTELNKPIARSEYPEVIPLVFAEIISNVITPPAAQASSFPGENTRNK